MPRLLAALLLLLVLAAAGCAAPEGDGPAAGDAPGTGGPKGTLVAGPPVLLSVDDLKERTLLVTVKNDRDAPLEVTRDAFTYADAAGGSWRVNASATDALDDGWPESRTVPARTYATGRLAFDLEKVEPPARLVYDDGTVNATWLLYYSQTVTVAPRDDTSFGQPIVLPTNGTIGFQLNQANAPVDVCVIDEEDHASWHDGQKADGLVCRLGATDADAAAIMPPGAYNIGMLCTSREAACEFSLTVVASW